MSLHLHKLFDDTSVNYLAHLLSLKEPNRHSRLLAERLLKEYSSLPRLLKTPVHLLLQIPGMNSQHIVRLKSFYTTHAWTLKRKLQNISLTPDNDDLHAYCLYTMSHLIQERVRVFYLDSFNHLIEDEVVEVGSLENCPFDQHDFFMRIYHLKAESFIIAHNHPSGSLITPPDDLHLTRHLYKAFKAVDIVMKGHLIVGSDQCAIIQF